MKSFLVKWKEERRYYCQAIVEAPSEAEAIRMAKEGTYDLEHADETFDSTISEEDFEVHDAEE